MSYVLIIIALILGCFLFGQRLLSLIIVTFILGWLCDIDSEESYTWISGIWHGMCFTSNFILSCFSDDVLYKANRFTTAYNIWWWVFSIQTTFGVLIQEVPRLLAHFIYVCIRLYSLIKD